MSYKVLYVERKPERGYVSIEKAFREIAAGLPPHFTTAFQQAPYGPRLLDTIRNFLFFRKEPADIYHVTGHINYIALLFSPKNTVLSIMDIRFVHNATGLRRFVLKKLYLDLPVRRLRYITAISNSVRDEILAYSKCEPSKVRTLDLPLIGHIVRGNEKPFDRNKPVILQIGTMPNKNIPNLAMALNGLSCSLRIVGNLTDAQTEVIEANNLDWISVAELTDEELRSEYANADIIAYCSTYEGFGLPIIEGQAMRKPVVTSNISPLKETAGDGACLVNPVDHMSIRTGIMRIIEDEGYRSELINRGEANVSRFSSKTVAKQYADLYAEMLDSRAG